MATGQRSQSCLSMSMHEVCHQASIDMYWHFYLVTEKLKQFGCYKPASKLCVCVLQVTSYQSQVDKEARIFSSFRQVWKKDGDAEH